MQSYKLIIGNKKYSTWSLRAWLALKKSGIFFEEVMIPIRKPDTTEKIKKFSKAAKVPALVVGEKVIWESLSICEFIAETHPETEMWPEDKWARAVARSVSNEMHAGFLSLRKTLPMNCRKLIKVTKMDAEVKRDFDRICEIWRDCRNRFGKEGDFLFGRFSIADCMFAPVAIRFHVYSIDLDPVCEAYQRAILKMSQVKQWLKEAALEKDVIEMYETAASLSQK